MTDTVASLVTIPCAAAECTATGTKTCSGCELVKYCSKQCQIEHRKAHKPACTSPLPKSSWAPSWVHEFRKPSFLTNEVVTPDFHDFGPKKYLCGNTPAFDHLDYAGLGDVKNPRILFAASGDLRNIISTINGRDPETCGDIQLVLNDYEPFVVARNLILLLLLGSNEDRAAIIEAAIHLWYSAFLPTASAALIRRVCSTHLDKMRAATFNPSASDSTLLSTQLTLPSATPLRIVWPRAVWKTLFSLLDARPLPHALAQARRNTIAMAASRRDYRDRHLCLIPARFRVSRQTLLEDGLVLPFGHARGAFTAANFTMFDPDTRQWMQQDSFSPLDGHDFTGVLAAAAALPANDVVGALYVYLVGVLDAFVGRLRGFGGRLAVVLTCADAAVLPRVLPVVSGAPERFDMVDVSNLTDHVAPRGGYLGVRGVLEGVVGPLLAREGRVVALFMNYSGNLKFMLGEEYDQLTDAMSACSRFLGNEAIALAFAQPGGVMGAAFIGLLDLSEIFENHEAMWKLYAEEVEKVEEVERKVGLEMRKRERRWEVQLDGRRKEEVVEEVKMLALYGIGTQEMQVVWGWKR